MRNTTSLRTSQKINYCFRGRGRWLCRWWCEKNPEVPLPRNCNAWRKKCVNRCGEKTMLAKREPTLVPVKHQQHSTDNDNDNDHRHPHHVFPQNPIDRSKNAHTTEAEQNEELCSMYWRRSSALQPMTAQDVKKHQCLNKTDEKRHPGCNNGFNQWETQH